MNDVNEIHPLSYVDVWEVFFMREIRLLVLSVLFGGAFIRLFPVHKGETISDLIVGAVLSPGGFFVASAFFIAGFILQGKVIKVEIQALRDRKPRYILMFTHLLSIFALTWVDWVHACVFISISCVYGMISLDLKREGGRHVGH
jgi:hypothetical protein